MGGGVKGRVFTRRTAEDPLGVDFVRFSVFL